MDFAPNRSFFQTSPSVPSNLTFDDYIFDNSVMRFGLYVVYTAVFCLCFFGNLAVVIVVTFHWRMRSVTKFCVGNLAFANLCVALFCIYQNMSTFLQEDWLFGRFLCKMYHFTNSLSHTASILILVVICGERFLSIVHPLRCRRMLTIGRLRMAIVGVWVLSAVISSPRLFYITTFEVPIPIGPDGHHAEICAPKRTLYNSRTADMIYFIVLFLLPLIVLGVLYTKIASVIWKSSAMLQPAAAMKTFTATARSSGAGNYWFHAPDVELAPTARRTSTDELYESVGDCKKNCKCEPERLEEGDEFGEAILSLQGPAVLTRLNDPRMGHVLQSRQAAIRLLIVIVITFALCNLPYHLRKICQYYMGSYNLWSPFNQLLTPLTFLLMYTNCAVNPFLYFFMSKNFRSSLRDLMELRLSRPYHGRVRRVSF